jgi:hypothetical protein
LIDLRCQPFQSFRHLHWIRCARLQAAQRLRQAFKIAGGSGTNFSQCRQRLEAPSIRHDRLDKRLTRLIVVFFRENILQHPAVGAIELARQHRGGAGKSRAVTCSVQPYHQSASQALPARQLDNRPWLQTLSGINSRRSRGPQDCPCNCRDRAPRPVTWDKGHKELRSDEAR